jgi:hypothetical protein
MTDEGRKPPDKPEQPNRSACYKDRSFGRDFKLCVNQYMAQAAPRLGSTSPRNPA